MRDLWEDFTKQHQVVAEVIKPEFLLKVISLLEGKETKKGTLLDVIDALDPAKFRKQWEIATQFMVEAYKRVTYNGGYGAFAENWIPYTTMLVPLAALLQAIQQRRGAEAMYRKVDRWYWASVFTQHYDSAVDTKTHKRFFAPIGGDICVI